MHNLRRWYYHNKEKVWKTILMVVLMLCIIYLLNGFILKKETENIMQTQSNEIYYNTGYNQTYIESSAALSGEQITQNDANRINQNISKFLEYCKNKKYEEAYEMLSNDCKENKYTTLEKFIKEYAETKINPTRIYEIQKWEGAIYKIEISEDVLASGNINNNEKVLEYITIVEEDGTSKLNINGYVGNREINKDTIYKKINVTVENKDIYMDYEIYTLKIKNLSNKRIKMDSLKNTGSIYLEDSEGNQYKAHKNELLDESLVIEAGITSELKIKFESAYKIGKKISKIIFEDVILDYDKYKKAENPADFEEVCELTISL